MESLVIQKVRVSNFLSFGESQEVAFTSNLNLVVGEVAGNESSNGAGKSSLFEAILLVHYR